MNLESILERLLHRPSERVTLEQLRSITDALPICVSLYDREGRHVFMNRAFVDWFGEPAYAPIIEARVRAVLRGETQMFETAVPCRAGGFREVRATYVPHLDGSGAVAGFIVIVADITDQKRTRDRLNFLAETSKILGSSLDYHETLQRLADVSVPSMADLCAVDMVAADGTIELVALKDVDPSRVELALELRRRYPPEVQPAGGILSVIRTKTPILLPSVSEDVLRDYAVDEAHLGIIRELRVRSALIAPIQIRDKVLGTITWVAANAGRSFTNEDLETAEKVAARAALAIENARLYQEAQDALQRAREAEQRKDQFLAMLGHELRNPLAPIVTALEVMKLRGDASCARERAVIERQVRHVVRLVDDLLDVSRITGGRIELRKQVLEIAEVVAKAVEVATPLLETKRHRLSVSVPREGLLVHADPIRLAQALGNLLTNAAKYTDSGGDIRVLARREDGIVRLAVRDDGAGIAPNLLPKIFEPFTQGPQGSARSGGGLGLGLAIVKSLVELHGGSVRAYSEGVGRGSEFVIDLPISVVVSCPTEIERSDALPAPSNCHQRVLVVDDNADAALTIASALAGQGYRAEIAADGPSALAVAEAFHPDVVLLDLGLPVMDGFEVAERLRSSAHGKDARLIALTGYGQASDQLRTKRAGFEQHLVKPVEFARLLAAIGAR